jgi:hypothetical protein
MIATFTVCSSGIVLKISSTTKEARSSSLNLLAIMYDKLRCERVV